MTVGRPPRLAQLDAPDASLVDIIDNVVNHGVVLHGEILLGVAEVDLIYARLALLLAAVDKVTDQPPRSKKSD